MNGKNFRSIAVVLWAFVLANHFSMAIDHCVCFQGGLSLRLDRKSIARDWTVLHESSSSSETKVVPLSHISSIHCKNFAGIVGNGGGDLELHFDLQGSSLSNNFVCVSGETGVGKSLLISKVVDLVTGGKASTSLLHNPTAGASAIVEIVLKLCNSDHINTVRQSLERMNIDPQTILQMDGKNGEPVCLSLKRSLTFPSSAEKGRLKSTCYLNDQQVSLKILKGVGAPLLPVVNAPVAANALGRAFSRIAMIDAGVSSDLLRRVSQLSKQYKTHRRERELLELELASRTLPVSMTGQDEKDVELLKHWIHELSGFQGRIEKQTRSLNTGMADSDSVLGQILDEISELDWMDSDGITVGFRSALYRSLLELSDQLILMDEKVEASLKARESIGSLSSPDSARTALERTRQILLDVGEQSATEESRVMAATERVHDLLNQVEMALTECTAFLDDEDNGLLAVLKNERSTCSVSSEVLSEYLLEWSTLARKHGVSPYLLPSCHAALQQELDGNVEARTLLPKAMAAEKGALAELAQECRILSQARSSVATRLSDSVSRRLPSLGMESRFSVRVQQAENPNYGLGLGVDEIDFFLFHENGVSLQDKETQASSKRGGKVELVASAGERARILLALECEVPGSIRALCGVLPPAAGHKSGESLQDDILIAPTSRPVAVIYDEIDAHVGGRASVSVAQMLSEQSASCQIVSITHSASVAATADMHICVQKLGSNGQTVVSANAVEGLARLKELARMASGDMAMEEAEAFAEALIRDALSRKRVDGRGSHSSTTTS
jgi:DNA repair ATPase RecN